MMNRSFLRASFGAIASSMRNAPSSSPLGTSPATFAGRSSTSNLVIRRMPLSPSIRRRQLTSTPWPSGVTMPRPVTTTRLWDIGRGSLPNEAAGRGRKAGSAMLLDVVDGVLDRQDLLGSLVRDLAAELLLERHDQLNRVQAVGAQIIDEAGILGHLALVDAKMLDDDLLDPLRSIAHRGFLIYWPGSNFSFWRPSAHSATAALRNTVTLRLTRR